MRIIFNLVSELQSFLRSGNFFDKLRWRTNFPSCQPGWYIKLGEYIVPIDNSNPHAIQIRAIRE